MLVLDTNHLRELLLKSAPGLRLQARLAASSLAPVIAVTTAEEVMRGRMANLASARTDSQLLPAYGKFDDALTVLSNYVRLPWDNEAARRFKEFRAQRLRIGTMDLRIACITLEHDATLLTRNAVDFAKVPGLRWENWLD